MRLSREPFLRRSPRSRVKPGALAGILLLLALTGTAPAVELADTPMFTRILPPPANLMFLLDDCGV